MHIVRKCSRNDKVIFSARDIQWTAEVGCPVGIADLRAGHQLRFTGWPRDIHGDETFLVRPPVIYNDYLVTALLTCRKSNGAGRGKGMDRS